MGIRPHRKKLFGRVVYPLLRIGIWLAIGASVSEVLLQLLAGVVTLFCARRIVGILLAFGLCHRLGPPH